jgi:hypothetical protein
MSRGSGHQGRRVLIGALAGAVAVAVGGAAWDHYAHSDAQTSPQPRNVAVERAFATVGNLPTSPGPAFRPARPTLLAHSRSETRWAPVIRATIARSRPDASARPAAELSTTTPEGTSNLVVVQGESATRGTLWARVQLPVLPNGTLGWIPRSALGGYHFVATRLVVDREDLVATLFRNGRPVFRAPVGVGQAHWPTPAGEFYVREKLTKFASPFYGPVAFGTNARSAVLTDWPGGGFIGIHGTDEPGLLPGRISHGCVRLRNEDILRLARLMPVGTPVTIE